MLESDLAWSLADEYRDCLLAEDRVRVFVNLGAGDFAEAIACLLEGCARQRIRLTRTAIALLNDWVRVYDRETAFLTAVARVSG